MKKNLMSVLILALLVVNLVLTAITMISIVPSAKKSNELIGEVCTALDLELASGRNANLASVPIENLVPYTLDGSVLYFRWIIPMRIMRQLVKLELRQRSMIPISKIS